MNRSIILFVFVGFLLGFSYAWTFFPEQVDALLSVPPTRSYSEVFINDTLFTTNGTMTSVSYRDTLNILTDGSIGINLTNWP